MDGHIRIKTKLDNSEIPKDLDEMVKELERLKQEQKELNDEAKKLDLNAKDYEKNANKIEAKIKELQEEEKKLKAFQEYSLNQEEFADYSKQLAEKQQEIALLKQEEDAYDKTLGQLEQVKYKLEENNEAQEQWNKRIEETKGRLAQADSIKGALNDIGTSIKGTIKKTLKWGLAIFSVRSAYMFIRQAASTLSQYNDDLKAKIEGIRLALASSLEPIIKRLVDWVITLLKYVNAISMALFGWDLFKNAKNMKSMSKSAKEIKNSLAGFDEMNVLADNSSSGSGAGGNFNYDDLYFGEGEEPWWIAWLRDNKDLVKEILGFLLAFGITFKALDLFTHLGGIGKALEGMFPILKNMGGLKIFGIIGGVALALKGIVDTVVAIKDMIEEPSWDNFSKILTGISEVLIGIGIALAIIFASNPVGWIMIAIGAVAMLTAYLIKNRQEIKERFIDNLKRDFESLTKPIKQVVDGIIKIFNGDLKGGLTSIMKGLVNSLINMMNMLIKGINKITTPIRGIIVAIGKVLGKNYTMSNIKIPEIPKLATGGIINRPTYAQIGEAGREAVLPLDRNTEWMNELAKKINASGGVVNVYLDGRLIQRQYNQRQEEFNFATNGGV